MSEGEIFNRFLRNGNADIQISYDTPVQFGKILALGFVATLEQANIATPLTIFLRPITETDEAASEMWIFSYTVKMEPQSVMRLGLKETEIHQQTFDPLYLNSPFAKLRIDRDTQQTMLPDRQGREIIGLDINFEWQTSLVPSDDANARTAGMNIAATVIQEVLTKATPLHATSKWHRFMPAFPVVESIRK